MPLALVAGAALLFRRLRPGARAALALVLGVFGIACGTEAAYYTVNGGPSGDDFTGWLSLAAGLLLLGLGAVTLWRTRRTDDSLRRRYLRRALLTIAGLLVATQVMFPLVIARVVTHTLRAHVPTPNLGAAHEDVSFTTSDGLRLRGVVRAVAERGDRDRLPGPLGPAEAGADADPKRLRGAALRPSRRRRERRRSRTSSAGEATATCMRPPPTSSRGATSTLGGSAPSASRSEARC